MSSDGPYKNPTPTVDLLIEIEGRPGTIVLIRRNNEPQGWALPGGFVDEGEYVADAAAREAKEETGLDVDVTELFHVYSDPRRDPRKHTVSTVFCGRARGEPSGGDDAAEARVVTEETLPTPVVFDHPTIIADYFTYRRTGKRPPPRR